jgi:threonyl-tRNA synthetase
MIVVIGDDEVANSKIALRDRRKRERSEMSKEEFLKFLKQNQAGEQI